MVRSAPTRFARTLHRAGPPALALSFMSFFGYYAVLGPNGVFAYGNYQRQIAERQAEYATLDKQRAVLRNHVNLLNPRHADPDMAEALVRKNLNVARPDEIIIPLGK